LKKTNTKEVGFIFKINHFQRSKEGFLNLNLSSNLNWTAFSYQ